MSKSLKVQIVEKARPAGIVRQYLPLFENKPPEFVDLQFCDQELDAGLSTILFFA